MLCVKMNGGLGNQMFQYAFYKYLKLDNDKVFIDLSDFLIHHHHNGFELEKVFDLKLSTIDKKQFKGSLVDHNKISYRLLNKLFNIYFTSDDEFIDNHGLSVVKRQTINKNIYFNGYWQDVTYINSVEAQLREDFQFKNIELDEKNISIIEEINNQESVSIHIRRGDYVNNPNFSGICDENYYLKSIELIKNKVKNPYFYIFSNDIEWCKNLFKDADNIKFVNWNKGSNSFLDMLLMSKCKYNIIANSTFSWWASWLNDNPNKIVIMPRQWTKKMNQNHLHFSESIIV